MSRRKIKRQVNRKVMWDQDDVLAWLDEQERLFDEWVEKHAAIDYGEQDGADESR